eukprot:10313718-Alexandrium_andersonii.AAC.1
MRVSNVRGQRGRPRRPRHECEHERAFVSIGRGGTRWHVHRVPIEPSSESNRSNRAAPALLEHAKSASG